MFPRSFGRYVLERSLSRGGMGDVYLAVARGFEKRCVIKTIRTDLSEEEEFVGRFTDEAKIMVRIDHPNIIRVFDAGKVRNEYYIAMEHLHGADLGSVLDRLFERGTRMPAGIGLYIASELLAGLDHVHRLQDEFGRPMGLVHRDISPQNVLVGFDGRVKLIDFGLARSELLPGRTQGSIPIGKYGYMSPQQARHEPIDGRADVYATGVMLFEVFTGARLVDEEDRDTLFDRVVNPQHRLPSTENPKLSHGIDQLVSRAAEPSLERRFESAASMRAFVESLREELFAGREELARVLRQLYAESERALAPLPNLTPFVNHVESSLIIATSTRRQRSVFGRGHLPIEGTMELDLKSLQRAIKQARAVAASGSVDDDEDTLTDPDALFTLAGLTPDTGHLALDALVAAAPPRLKSSDLIPLPPEPSVPVPPPLPPRRTGPHGPRARSAQAVSVLPVDPARRTPPPEPLSDRAALLQAAVAAREASLAPTQNLFEDDAPTVPDLDEPPPFNPLHEPELPATTDELAPEEAATANLTGRLLETQVTETVATAPEPRGRVRRAWIIALAIVVAAAAVSAAVWLDA